jgi:hypothetical protein
MADNIPSLPGGGVPPKPPEASKVQPKKETVRINLPPKPSAAPTIKLPTLPPGGPTAGAPSSFPPPTQIATPTGSKAAAAPVAPVRPAPQRAAPAPPPRAAISPLDKVLAVVALIAVIAAAVSTGWCMNILMHDGLQ